MKNGAAALAGSDLFALKRRFVSVAPVSKPNLTLSKLKVNILFAIEPSPSVSYQLMESTVLEYILMLPFLTVTVVGNTFAPAAVLQPLLVSLKSASLFEPLC